MGWVGGGGGGAGEHPMAGDLPTARSTALPYLVNRANCFHGNVNSVPLV